MKKVHETNKVLGNILRTLYTIARTAGAMCDGGLPAREVQPKEWKAEQKEKADEFSKAILMRVVHPALKPYEKAIILYGQHTPDCDFWQGDGKECSCGLEAVKRTIQANLVLQ